MKNLLDTKTASLQDLLGNGKIYKIPDFQRDYSWTEENWEDLWDDCLFLEKNEEPHYMGTILLQNTDTKNLFIVVDGQQRLSTITIFIVAMIQFLQDLINANIDIELNKKRIEQIKRRFIGEETISKLHYESKLRLNNNNNNFFQDRILTRKEPISYQKLRDSEKLIYGAYIYFYEKIKEKFKDDNGQKIAEFLEHTISYRLIFIQITVDDDLNAYTVFETLNARGISLTTTDLLKNYLFVISAKTTSESEMNILKDNWANLIDSIGLKTFPIFLRYFLNSRQQLVRKEQLFKNIKNTVNSSDKVFVLLDELEKKADLYNALKNPYDDFWNEHPQKNEIKKLLEEIKLFGVSQPITLLFSAYEKLPDIFHKILKMCVAISFRYNIIGRKNPNEMERVYNSVAQKIYNQEINNERKVFEYLQSVYVNDEDFKNLFLTKEITTGGKNKKLVKYILTKIENHISNKDSDFNDANFTIEHILPENFNESWEEVFNGNATKFVYRLGNYTLLEDYKNRECADKNFSDKKKLYKTSQYKLTNEYLNFEEWNISILNSYQEKLAKQAIAVWKITMNK